MASSDTADLREPLKLKTEDVLARLQEQLDEERAKRQEESERQKQARLAVNQIVLDETDQIVGYLWRSFNPTSWADLEKRLTDFFEANDLRAKAIKPSHHENSLEKFVRVLGMASNTTLTIEPSDSLYELL